MTHPGKLYLRGIKPPSFQGPFSLCPAMEKSHFVVCRARIRATAQSFCSVSHSPGQRGLARLVFPAASAACGVGVVMDRGAWRPVWATEQAGASEQERSKRNRRGKLLGLGMMRSPMSAGLRWLHPSGQYLFVPRLDGQTSTSPTSSRLHCACTHLPLSPVPAPVMRKERTCGSLGSGRRGFLRTLPGGHTSSLAPPLLPPIISVREQLVTITPGQIPDGPLLI